MCSRKNIEIPLTNSMLETSDAAILLKYVKEQNLKKRKPKLFGTSTKKQVSIALVFLFQCCKFCF